MKIPSHSELFPSRAAPPATGPQTGPASGSQASSGAGAPAPATAARQQPQPDQNAVEAAVEAVNRAMALNGAQVQFTIDKDLGRTIVRVIDTETKKVLRQFPSEEMIAIARNIDRMRGTNIQDVV